MLRTVLASTLAVVTVTAPYVAPASAATVTRNAHCTVDFPGDFRHYDDVHTVIATFDGPVVTGQPVHVTLDVVNSAGTSYFDPPPARPLASNITFQVYDGDSVSELGFVFGAGHSGTTIVPNGATGEMLSITWKGAGALFAVTGGIGEGIYTCDAADTRPAVSATIGANRPACHGRTATIIGTRRADVLMGTPGSDVIVGGDGDDVIEGGGGDDEICGGAGHDVVSYQHAPSGVAASLTLGAASGGAGNDRLHSIEGIVGSTHADLLIGTAGRDVLRGGPGDDALVGLAQSDTLDGGGGHDSIDGGSGTDNCSRGETLVRCP